MTLDLEAYFDESGTDAKSKVVVVGGYIAPALAWRELETRWRCILRTEGATYYHATDAEGGRTPRGPYKGWGKRKANRFTDRVASVATSAGLEGVAVHVATEEWLAAADLIKPHLSPSELAAFPNAPHSIPFQILARTCIDLILTRVDPNLEVGEKIAFTFEKNDFTDAALQGYAILQREHPKRSRLGTIAFEEKQGFPALQAADLFAWQYRRVCMLRRAYSKGDIHRGVRFLVKPSFVFGSLGKDELCRQVSDAIGRVLRGEVQ